MGVWAVTELPPLLSWELSPRHLSVRQPSRMVHRASSRSLEGCRRAEDLKLGWRELWTELADLQGPACPLPPPAFPSQALSLSPFAPSWLLQDPELRLRTTNKGFVQAVDQYFDHLMARVVPLQVKSLSFHSF